jgi:putative transposase
MPRQARIDAPGALHHIIARGIERRNIFRDDQDRDRFLARMEKVLTDTGTPCYAWALLPNHFHLLLRTGNTLIPNVMRRLLTGHAVYFNLRHRRHGHLFQNRYKSILCQEDSYFLELVRYIHLNPLRAKLVEDIVALGSYRYAGHRAILESNLLPWQDAKGVLRLFAENEKAAKARYLEFVARGVPLGRRPDLVGGGLIRSAGGWRAVKALHGLDARLKGDERILGDSEFVLHVLQQAQEQLETRCKFQEKGYDLEWLAARISDLLGISTDSVWAANRKPVTVKARSLLCYWGGKELGYTMSAVAKRLGITQSAAGYAYHRGDVLIKEKGYKLDG